tara:strand:+ start:8005 stop:8238 length:234 start_codon:yes stop_codon:yes gene_type:complete
MKLDKIQVVGEHNQLQIREINDDGKYHRRVLSPDSDVSSESSEIQEKAEQLWTNELKDSWSASQEEAEAKRKARMGG